MYKHRAKHTCLCCHEQAQSSNPRDHDVSESTSKIVDWAQEFAVHARAEFSDDDLEFTRLTSFDLPAEAIDDSQDLTDEEANKLRMEAARRRNKKYGKKTSKTIPTPMFILDESDLPSSEVSAHNAIEEVTNALGNVTLDQEVEEAGDDDGAAKTARKGDKKSKSVKDSTLGHKVTHAKSTSKPKKLIDPVTDVTDQLRRHTLEDKAREKKTAGSTEDKQKVASKIRVPDAVLAALAPLRDAYKNDREGQHMMILTWDDVLQGSSKLIKIAEASFAQVFRVENSDGTSILKFVELQAGTVPNPGIDSTSLSDLVEPAPVESVVSEFRVMNALTVIPGFVNFKDAHIVVGKPPAKIKQAYDDFKVARETADAEYLSYFPDPASYDEQAVFLFLELGDAGVALDDVEKCQSHPGCSIKGLKHVEWVWDVLLGVILALARAESTYQFEHRDLHQNNICLNLENAIHQFPDVPETGPKLGRSGIRITILDYGLSRATLDEGEDIYADLEVDLAVFQSLSATYEPLEDLQYLTYRKMRTHLFFDNFSASRPPSWHVESSKRKNNGHTWEEYTPYSNVLWVAYLYEFLCSALSSDPYDPNAALTEEQREFLEETSELKKRLVHSWKNDQRFFTASEILEYTVMMGWVTEEQVLDFDY